MNRSMAEKAVFMPTKTGLSENHLLEFLKEELGALE